MSQSAQPSPPRFQVLASRHFPAWLLRHHISLAFTTYQSGKLFLVGVKSEDRLSVFERTFNRAMGLWSNGQTMWLASAYQLWRMENVLETDERIDGYDRLYVPRFGFITGDIDVHDIAADQEGQPLFISTLFSCLGRLDSRLNFDPVWLPPFIDKLAAEDRCHLNGLCLQDGRAKYATACATTNIVDGWRDHRDHGGVIIDVSGNQIMADGFSMPHSPRLYRHRLWVLDSGRGYFGYVDRSSGRFERVTFCPGYARGLAFVERFAVVGVSRPRHEPTFAGLPLEAELSSRQATSWCGLQVIDLDRGEIVHWLRIEGVVEELYDVVVLPGTSRPKAFGFKTDEIRHNVWVKQDGHHAHWSAHSK
jgi:uncharacterized protein (TIGR03032 family)